MTFLLWKKICYGLRVTFIQYVRYLFCSKGEPDRSVNFFESQWQNRLYICPNVFFL